MKEEQAASVIQRSGRGWLARKRFAKIRAASFISMDMAKMRALCTQDAGHAIAFARAVFYGADKDGDRSLSKNEIKKYFKKNPLQKQHILGNDFQWATFFNGMDLDGDGSFDIREFSKAICMIFHDELVTEEENMKGFVYGRRAGHGHSWKPEPLFFENKGPNAEATFIMIKPDGVNRGLVGAITERFEERGFHLLGMKMCSPQRKHIEKHYADLKDMKFFPGLVDYMMSGPVVCMVWQGLNVVATGRSLLGETKPQESKPGTIRGDFCVDVGRNVIHGSDSVKAAVHEISQWFIPGELTQWVSRDYFMVYESI